MFLIPDIFGKPHIKQQNKRFNKQEGVLLDPVYSLFMVKMHVYSILQVYPSEKDDPSSMVITQTL